MKPKMPKSTVRRLGTGLVILPTQPVSTWPQEAAQNDCFMLVILRKSWQGCQWDQTSQQGVFLPVGLADVHRAPHLARALNSDTLAGS